MARRSDRRLARFSREHLGYELWMLGSTGRALQDGEGRDNRIVANMLVESFGMHARNIIEFLYGANRRCDDVGAEEYVTNVNAWIRARGGQPRRLQAATRRAGKQLHHLTLKRYRSGPRKGWPVVRILMDLERPLKAFLEHAARPRLHRKVVNLIRTLYPD